MAFGKRAKKTIVHWSFSLSLREDRLFLVFLGEVEFQKKTSDPNRVYVGMTVRLRRQVFEDHIFFMKSAVRFASEEEKTPLSEKIVFEPADSRL